MGTIAHKHTLLDGTETAGQYGDWRLFQGLRNPSVQVDGIVSGDVVKLWGTNDEDPDDASVNEHQLGSDITEDDIYNVDPGPRWIRAEMDATAGGGTVTAELVGQEYT